HVHSLVLLISPCFRPNVVFLSLTLAATSLLYTLSLHDSLPISWIASFSTLSATPASWSLASRASQWSGRHRTTRTSPPVMAPAIDRKSTRLNSSHQIISYAVFGLKKKNRADPTGRGSVPARPAY